MTEAPRMLVVGAGGHAKVVVAALRAASIRVEAVLDDDPSTWGEPLLGAPVVGPIAARAVPGRPAILAIGDNRARAALAARLELAWHAVVHPAAWVDPDATLGPGAFVAAGAVVQPGAAVGAHAIVNTGAVVDHDAVVGDFAHVAPGAALAGGVRVGEGALVGVGAAVLPGVAIGAWAVLGAGAAAHRDLAPEVTGAGVPARPLDDR